MNESRSIDAKPSTGTANLVYILYLVSVVFGITSLIGVVIAYINRSDSPAWVAEHYRYQIRTFWIGLVYLTLGVVLTFVLVGYLILFLYLIWLIIRSVKGMKCLSRGQGLPNVTSWLF